MTQHEIHTRQAEEADAQYILDAYGYIQEADTYVPDKESDAHEAIQKQIVNPDWRRYIVAMAGSAIVGAAYLVETPMPAAGKRGQYIDMMRVSRGNRCEEVEQRLISHAARIAIENAPDRSAERSFLRIDSLTQTLNVETNNLRLKDDDLTAAAQLLR